MKNVLFCTSILLLLLGCNQNENSAVKQNTDTAEESLVQEAQTLKSDKGETISLTYFAHGDQVAVKVKKAEEAQRTLLPSGTSERGNPVFSDGSYLWEMSPDGKSGSLTDDSKTVTEYK